MSGLDIEALLVSAGLIAAYLWATRTGRSRRQARQDRRDLYRIRKGGNRW